MKPKSPRMIASSMTRRDVQGQNDSAKARVFLATVATLTVAAVLVATSRITAHISASQIAFWALIVAIVELLPVPLSKTVRLSLGFPILLGIAILYSSTPPIAALLALLRLGEPAD